MPSRHKTGSIGRQTGQRRTCTILPEQLVICVSWCFWDEMRRALCTFVGRALRASRDVTKHPACDHCLSLRSTSEVIKPYIRSATVNLPLWTQLEWTITKQNMSTKNCRSHFESSKFRSLETSLVVGKACLLHTAFQLQEQGQRGKSGRCRSSKAKKHPFTVYIFLLLFFLTRTCSGDAAN